MTSEPSPRRGVIALISDACTSCMLCVKECPTWCIELDSHPEQIEELGARPRTVNVLDDFRIDYGLCMYCGICIEVCPFDALEWKPDFNYPASTRSGLSQDTQQLARWLAESASDS